MARLPRINIEESLYYVSCKAIANSAIFLDDKDYCSFLVSLDSLKASYNFKLFAFTLLPDSYHLLIELQHGTNISEVMHSLNSTYTKSFNKSYKRKGHLFHSRFRSILLEKKDYLPGMINYIHSGAGEIIDDPAGYKYSSYRYYTDENRGGYSPVDMGEEIKEAIGCTGNVLSSIDTAEAKKFKELLHRKQFLGPDEFVKKVKLEISRQSKKTPENISVKKGYRSPVLVAEVLVLLMGIGVIHFYTKSMGLKIQSDSVQKSFELAKWEFVEKTNIAKKQMEQAIMINGETSMKIAKGSGLNSRGLNGSFWDIKIVENTKNENKQIYRDWFRFEDGKFNSYFLSNRGYPGSNFSVTAQDNGSLTWETIQTAKDGSTACWYGEFLGDKMKGIFTERKTDGTQNEYYFVSERSEFYERI